MEKSRNILKNISFVIVGIMIGLIICMLSLIKKFDDDEKTPKTFEEQVEDISIGDTIVHTIYDENHFETTIKDTILILNIKDNHVKYYQKYYNDTTSARLDVFVMFYVDKK